MTHKTNKIHQPALSKETFFHIRCNSYSSMIQWDAVRHTHTHTHTHIALTKISW